MGKFYRTKGPCDNVLHATLENCSLWQFTRKGKINSWLTRWNQMHPFIKTEKVTDVRTSNVT